VKISVSSFMNVPLPDKIGVEFVILELIRQKLVIIKNTFAQRQEGVNDGVEDEAVSSGCHFSHKKSDWKI